LAFLSASSSFSYKLPFINKLKKTENSDIYLL
jgi:hypothetical protein